MYKDENDMRMHYKKCIRKIVFSLCLSLIMTGCYSTISVTSGERFNNRMDSIGRFLGEMGYEKTSTSKDWNIETLHNIVELSMQKMDLPHSQGVKKKETVVTGFSLTDSIGNLLTYSVAYEIKESREKILYVDNVNVLYCETSNKDHQDLLCGVNSEIMQINNIEKVDKVSVENKTISDIVTYLPVIVVVLFLPFITLKRIS